VGPTTYNKQFLNIKYPLITHSQASPPPSLHFLHTDSAALNNHFLLFCTFRYHLLLPLLFTPSMSHLTLDLTLSHSFSFILFRSLRFYYLNVHFSQFIIVFSCDFDNIDNLRLILLNF